MLCDQFPLSDESLWFVSHTNTCDINGSVLLCVFPSLVLSLGMFDNILSSTDHCDKLRVPRETVLLQKGLTVSSG